MKHVHVDFRFDVPDEATDDEIANVVANAAVQVEEPITGYDENQNELTWTRATRVQSTYTEVDGRPLI